jgi:putative PEP-CTERM system TPR-repeat lipoprotein
MYFGSQREFERARAYLGRVLESTPNNGRALRGLANVEFAAGNPQAAERALRQALSAEPKSPDLHLALARLQLGRNDMVRARTELDAAIAAGDGRANVYNAAGLLLADGQRFEEALAEFRRATELDPSNAAYWLNAGRAQVALNQPAAARESINKALALRADWMPAASLLVLLDLRSSDPGVALKRAQELRSRQPAEPAAIALEGDVRMVMKDYAGATKCYEDAERVHPDASLAVKTFEAMRLNDVSQPEAPLTRWLALQPEDARVRAVLAQYYMKTGQSQRAQLEFETLGRQLPNNPVALNNLAWLYHVRGDARAEDTARRAHELAPTNPAIADTYGWILLGKRQVPQALVLLEKASTDAPDNPEIRYHYGAALAAAGRHTAARTALTAAIEAKGSFPQRAEAEKLLAQLRN